MQDDTHTALKDRLLHRQRELQDLEAAGRDAAGVVELDQTRQGRLSRMDALQGQAMSQELSRRRVLELQRIAAALQRMEAGEYGLCLNCDEAIASKRLEFDPAAAYCIDCASKRESH